MTAYRWPAGDETGGRGDLVRIAERVIYVTYGDTVSVESKGKPLNKFGRTANADSGVRTTIAQFQGDVVNETFVSTNIIDSIVCDSDATQVITIEGHTIDGSGNLTFITQNATLNGQTEVTLGTPMARANRAYVKASGTFNSPQSALAGNVYIYDNTGGISSGVPVVPAATKAMILTGETQTQKGATSISSTDYWLLTGATFSISRANNASVDFEIETRDVKNGGVWRPLGIEITLNTASQEEAYKTFAPYRIVPPNHDVRAVATSSAANVAVTCDFQGMLAKIL